MAESAPTNWLDVLKAGFWPVLALIALIMLYGPISRFAGRLGPAEEIQIGSLRLKLSEEGAQSIPPPSEAVAEALASLDSLGLERLLTLEENSSYSVCVPSSQTGNNSVQTNDRDLAILQLAELEIVRIEPSGDEPPDYCRGQSYAFARLTSKGVQTRRYLTNFVTRVLTVSSSG